jgi:PIN domain nuclease of toxin-antitoxin system
VRLLLDSHTLYWALYEPEKLSANANHLVADTSNEIFVSLSSLWELANKAAIHRLPLAGSSVEALAARIEDLGVTWLSLTKDVILAAANLPPHHLDPFDRILVALAQAHLLDVVTKDPMITLYDVAIRW